MQLLVKIIGALGIVAIAFLTTLWLLDGKVSTCPSGRTVALSRPFAKLSGGGFTYTTELKDINVPSDTVEAPNRSTLVLCEDDDRIGTAHSMHADIARMGRGRYSHWGSSLLFSASDNSDPNTNGRRYTVVQPQ